MQATAGKPLALWTSLDVKYTGSFAAHYEVEMLQAGAIVGKTLCNPFDVSTRVSSKQVNIGDSHSQSSQADALRGHAPGGRTTVRAKVIVDQRPPTLEIRDISLVVKE